MRGRDCAMIHNACLQQLRCVVICAVLRSYIQVLGTPPQQGSRQSPYQKWVLVHFEF